MFSFKSNLVEKGKANLTITLYSNTNREQLRHHRSLRNAAYQLRSMSSKDNLNDNPNGGFQYGPLDEEPYSEETQRRRPPRDGRGPPSSSPR